ncbi:TLC domain-containing protein 5-like [Hydractinia symbiolongicarpus]|uniref:TLC domain-containing protein 5-like n=1 Tax=Hydractinia symbiolongicarpus TaxID=13093 RepID=UPI00254FC760|nr:TLC domain-containing protein 5-like [Hydractinia symbiolongicarpus]
MFLVLLTLTSWTLFYYVLKRYNHMRSSEWNSRIVALMHALLITKMVETCFFIGPWPYDSMGEANTLTQYVTMSISAGYFLFEIAWCVVMQTEGFVMLLHHFISLTGLISSLYIDKCGSEVSAVIWGSELTNPFLQIRWFLRETKQYQTIFAYINDWLFFLTFAVVRVGIGATLGYAMYFSVGTPIIVKIGGYLFYLIGLVWMYQIFKFAQKRLFITPGRFIQMKRLKENKKL